MMTITEAVRLRTITRSEKTRIGNMKRNTYADHAFNQYWNELDRLHEALAPVNHINGIINGGAFNFAQSMKICNQLKLHFDALHGN